MGEKRRERLEDFRDLPSMNPRAGSKNRVPYALIDPVMGR
jgi:hypothetical protein